MKKRRFLQAVLASGGAVLVSQRYLNRPNGNAGLPSVEPLLESPTGSVITSSELETLIVEPQTDLPSSNPVEELELVILEENELHPSFKHIEREIDVDHLAEGEVENYLEKIRNFDSDFHSDIFLNETQSKLLLPTLGRLGRVQSFVGHGNFNLLGFDEMIFFARNYSAIGAFEKEELEFMEEIFSFDASSYGFFGQKIIPSLTNRVSQKDVQKIRGSGHYLLMGESLNHYEQIRNDVGHDLLLTSGVRNIVKQMHLFMSKTFQADGNLSKASRSLAPPGHSFHGVGDFDVGKVGLGELNFTSDFSFTEEFKRMITLGYVDIRYTDSNEFGVRYEPWHIKIS